MTAADTNLVSPLAEALTHASWRLRRASVKELAPLGLTFAQSRVLRILARRDEPIRIGDLAARFEVAPRSATSMIDSLETLGLVERRADPTDRRSVLVGLTPEGLALMRRIGDARRVSAELLFGRLTAAQQAQLLEMLTLLTAADEDCGAVASDGGAKDASDGGASGARGRGKSGGGASGAAAADGGAAG